MYLLTDRANTGSGRLPVNPLLPTFLPPPGNPPILLRLCLNLSPARRDISPPRRSEREPWTEGSGRGPRRGSSWRRRCPGPSWSRPCSSPVSLSAAHTVPLETTAFVVTGAGAKFPGSVMFWQELCCCRCASRPSSPAAPHSLLLHLLQAGASGAFTPAFIRLWCSSAACRGR